jgi:pimeloyl-ACP methyl ester carboxylesterase
MPAVDEVRVRDGRRVALYRLAEGAGDRTVLLCHSAPGSGAFDPDPNETSARGVTLLAVDRPGYGGSDPPGEDEWASVSGAADDVAEVLDQLGTGPVGVAGWSAGGRIALALAARRPELVDRVAVLATPAPDEEVPWIPPEQKQGLEALRDQPPAEVHAALAEQLSAMVPRDPAAPGAVGLVGATSDDNAALEAPGARERLGEMLVAAFAQGAKGMAADIAGYCLRPWGFEPAEVRAKTLLLYGSRDATAGPRHGSWWQERLRDARLEVVPGAGHLLVIPMWARVLSHLAPRGQR